ncbi:MAG: hypothetical protein KAI47_22715 [Deltaproteobacteria bacterium]|nr:hypothetical protein [Deltaproteobacteria bacterium]
MDSYNFSLLISHPAVDEETAADMLYRAGCDDALFSVSCGLYEVEFDREAPSFHAAISSAIKDVDRARMGSRVFRVIPDDLVNANAIAERSGKTRQAVGFWTLGERGEGFPAPRAIVGKSPVWSWMSIARWLYDRGDIDADVIEAARVIAEINRMLEVAFEQRAAQPSVIAAGA